jgi:hypothetical protein
VPTALETKVLNFVSYFEESEEEVSLPVWGLMVERLWLFCIYVSFSKYVLNSYYIRTLLEKLP